MSEPTDPLKSPGALAALSDALPEEDRAALRRALDESPVLAEAFARWTALRAAVRRDLDAALPDRGLLVLYALADEPGLLDAEEQARLDAARPALDAALAQHPALADAVRRLRADRDAFARAWADHTETTSLRRVQPVLPERAADRTAVRPPARMRPVRWAWRGAALFAVTLFVSALAFVLQRDAGLESVQTAAGETRTIELPDGSTIDLAPASLVMVPEAGADNPRRARLLAGRALFDVAHDADVPFVVETHNAAVTVLGTTFNVAVTDIATDVVLVQGAVTLAPLTQPEVAVRLAPGQASRVLARDAPAVPAPADLDAALAWTGRLFVQEEPLGQLAARLQARFGVPVEVAPALAEEAVSGVFEAEDGVEDVLRTLALTLDARLVRLPGGGFRLEAGAEPGDPAGNLEEAR